MMSWRSITSTLVRVQVELAALRDGADLSAASHAVLEARLCDADAALKVCAALAESNPRLCRMQQTSSVMSSRQSIRNLVYQLLLVQFEHYAMGSIVFIDSLASLLTGWR